MSYLALTEPIISSEIFWSGTYHTHLKNLKLLLIKLIFNVSSLYPTSS